jgi:dephospho-CoA kinase
VSTPYVIREAAILFESGSESGCNKVLCVSADKEQRIERVVKRDGLNRGDILIIMDNQLTDEERTEKSDFQISNSNSDFILSDLQKLHKTFLKLSLSSKNEF